MVQTSWRDGRSGTGGLNRVSAAAVGRNWNVAKSKTVWYSGPKLAATAVSRAGAVLGHRPVSTRANSVRIATISSAGVNAQCVARPANSCRTRSGSPRRATRSAYQRSYAGSAASATLWSVTTGAGVVPLGTAWRSSHAFAPASARTRGAAASAARSSVRSSPAAR